MSSILPAATHELDVGGEPISNKSSPLLTRAPPPRTMNLSIAPVGYSMYFINSIPATMSFSGVPFSGSRPSLVGSSPPSGAPFPGVDKTRRSGELSTQLGSVRHVNIVDEQGPDRSKTLSRPPQKMARSGTPSYFEEFGWENSRHCSTPPRLCFRKEGVEAPCTVGPDRWRPPGKKLRTGLNSARGANVQTTVLHGSTTFVILDGPTRKSSDTYNIASDPSPIRGNGRGLTCTFTISETLTRNVAVALFMELLLRRCRALAARAMAAAIGFGSLRLDILYLREGFLSAVDFVNRS